MPGKYMEDENMAQLALDIENNKPGALDKLLNIYGKAIYGYIRGKSLLSDADTEDIYQEAVVSIWRNIGGFDSQTQSMPAFLLSIADNALSDFYKAAASEGNENEGYVYEDDEDYETPEYDHERDYEHCECDHEHDHKHNHGHEHYHDHGHDHKHPHNHDHNHEHFYEYENEHSDEKLAELLPELKGTPDFVVLNSPYLFEKYSLLFKTLMGDIEPDYQAIAYAALKLAGGAQRNIAGLTANDLVERTLFELLLLFKRAYSVQSGIPDEELEDEILLMFNKLNKLEGKGKLGAMKLGRMMEMDNAQKTADAQEPAGARETADVQEPADVRKTAGVLDFEAVINRKIHKFIDENFLDIFKV